MNWQVLGDFLARTLPSIRTTLALSGFVVATAAVLIVRLVSPGNTTAMLTAGSIGISLVVFGQVFHFLRDFPRNQRALVFIATFLIFVVLIISMTIITITLLQQPSLEITVGESDAEDSQKSIMRIAQADPVIVNDFDVPASEFLPAIFDPNSRYKGLIGRATSSGTAVQYIMQERGDVLYIMARMPYREIMHGSGYMTPITLDNFAWPPPVLSFKISNPRSQQLFISSMIVDTSSIVLDTDPIIWVWNVMKNSSSDIEVNICSKCFPLVFYNIAWGRMIDPKLSFSIVRDDDVEGAAAGPFLHEGVPMKERRGGAALYLGDYIDFTMERDLPGDFHEHLNIVGEVEYDTESDGHRVVRFRSVIYFNQFGPGRINPSFRYNVILPLEEKFYPFTVPLSQCVAGRSADNFLIGFLSRKSAQFDLTLTLKSTDGVVLSKRVVLSIVVPNQYGLSGPPDRTTEYSVLGCS